MAPDLILESLVAVLLAVTIGYCFVLNRRLAALRKGQGELQNVARILDEAAGKARIGVEQLRRASLSIADELSAKVTAGRALADELGMIVDSGNNLADRLTASVTPSRAAGRKSDPLETLSRLDEGFRRQVERAGGGPEKPALPENETAAESELRLALRATR